VVQVIKLLHVVGDVRNLYAAFFLGQVEKITGPISAALLGSPERPLRADELSSVVLRLSELSPEEREGLQISVFVADMSPEDVEEQLSKPGAEALGVWTHGRPGAGVTRRELTAPGSPGPAAGPGQSQHSPGAAGSGPEQEAP
jgi:hypothetical protein